MSISAICGAERQPMRVVAVLAVAVMAAVMTQPAVAKQAAVTQTEPGNPRISFQAIVSLEAGNFSTETVSSSYDVPEGSVLVIENVQYDTNAACFYKYEARVIADRPTGDGGVRFDRYNLAIVSPTEFSSGGGAFLSAAVHRVSINVPPLGAVRFGFSRNNADCFGQIRYRVDGRLEAVR